MNSQGIVRPESKVARSNRDALADVGRLSRQGFILEKRLRRSTDWYNLNHARLWMAKGDSEGGRFDKKDGFPLSRASSSSPVPSSPGEF
jgi:hypothetical protein